MTLFLLQANDKSCATALIAFDANIKLLNSSNKTPLEVLQANHCGSASVELEKLLHMLDGRRGDVRDYEINGFQREEIDGEVWRDQVPVDLNPGKELLQFDAYENAESATELNQPTRGVHSLRLSLHMRLLYISCNINLPIV